MEKPICQNFTELAAYLRDIDPAAATSIAKSILERVDIPELREFVTPPPNPWVDITKDCLISDSYTCAVGVQVPFVPGDALFFTPFIVVANPEWDRRSFSPSGNPTDGGGYEVALREGKIMRRKI